MYNSRKSKVRFAKGSLVPSGLTGLSLAPDKTTPQLLEPEPAAPHMAIPRTPSPVEEQEEIDDEYTQHAKKQAKNKLESITGRLFQGHAAAIQQSNFSI